MEEGYFDIDGKPVTLQRLIRNDPEWAANRIRASVTRIAELEQRLAAAESRIAELVKGIQQAMEELTETGTCHETLEKLIEVE